MGFSVKDIVLIALISAAMLVVGSILFPLIIPLFATVPGLGVLLVSPFFGLLLAIALVKVGKMGTATAISLIIGTLLLFINPVMFFLFVAGGISADLSAFLLGTYRKGRMVPVVTGMYMLTMYFLGLVFGALFVLEGYALQRMFGEQLALVIGMGAVAFLSGAGGGYLGRRLLAEIDLSGSVPFDEA
jgi:energy-coupling factor transport system substrate-specific component